MMQDTDSVKNKREENETKVPGTKIRDQAEKLVNKKCILPKRC